MAVLNFILTQIFSQTWILFPVVSFIGYLALGEKMSKAVAGLIKTAVGVLVMAQGSSLLIKTFTMILAPLNAKFGMTGILLDTYTTMTMTNNALGEFVTWTSYTMLFAFILNLVLVALQKYTHARTVFLTGNVMLVQTAIATYIVYRFLHTGALATIAIASVACALYWIIFSGILINPVKDITGVDDFTIGHQQMFGSWCAYKVGGKLGDPKKSVENLKLPSWLSIFQDNVVASSSVLTIFILIIMIMLGPDVVREMAGNTNWIIFAIKIGLTMGVALYILLTGVRMFVSEIMTSFQGISNKLLPGSVVAVDCAAIFSFSPNAVLLGFISGAFGMILSTLGLIAFHSPLLIIPGFIPMFFDNATIGIFANKTGGWKATIIVCFVAGVIEVLGAGLAASLMGVNAWQGSFDWSTIWVAVIYLFKAIGSLFGIMPV